MFALFLWILVSVSSIWKDERYRLLIFTALAILLVTISAVAIMCAQSFLKLPREIDLFRRLLGCDVIARQITDIRRHTALQLPVVFDQ